MKLHNRKAYEDNLPNSLDHLKILEIFDREADTIVTSSLLLSLKELGMDLYLKNGMMGNFTKLLNMQTIMVPSGVSLTFRLQIC